MLYQLHEMQRAFLTPFAAFTDAGSQLFSSPYSPLAYTPISRQMAAGYKLMTRIGKEYQKPAWNPVSYTHLDVYKRQGHHRMQRAVAVGLGPRDVIVELVGQRRPHLVDHAQRHVAGAHVVDCLLYTSRCV